HGPDRLVYAVEVERPCDALVDVVRRAVGRLEDRVQGQRAALRPPRHDVPELIPGEVAVPLPEGHLGRVDERRALHVGLAAVHRDADVDVRGRGDVVLDHVDDIEIDSYGIVDGYRINYGVYANVVGS